MLLLLVLVLVSTGSGTPQLTPVLIGRDVYTPGLILCSKPDVSARPIHHVRQVSVELVNTAQFRCTLADVLSGKQHHGKPHQLYRDDVRRADARSQRRKMIVNLRYADGRYYQLQGVLQLWMLTPGSNNNYQYPNG